MNNLNFIFVFFEGLLSFLSPCVLPLLPVYIGYLAGNGKEIDEDGKIKYNRKKVFINTLLFVLGISFAFFILGMSFSTLGSFFQANRRIFTIIAGVLIIFMGLMQLGIFQISFLHKEYKLKTKKNLKKMNPILAFILGFTFSFAWTPCIGPVLASILMLASSSGSILQGNLLVLVYTIGFSIPFLLVGFFTTELLNFLKNHQAVLKYTIKISAIILILVGILTLTGSFEGITAYFTNLGNQTSESEQNQTIENTQINEEENQQRDNNTNEGNQGDDSDTNSSKAAIDFTLIDQNGKSHQLSKYKGKVVFLNFWTTWCGYCKKELPDLQELYQEYGNNQNEVIFLGVTNPKTEKSQYASDVSVPEIKQFIKQNDLTFPMLFDETSEIYASYSVYSFPTSLLINQKGEVEWYSPGAMPKQKIKSEIDKVLEK